MRTPPRSAAVALALLLVLSGCSALGGGSGDGLSPDERPPGVADGTLENASALTAAHAGALERSGFESDLTVNATIVTRGELYDVSRRSRVVVEPNATSYVHRTTNRGDLPNARFDYWGNDSVQVRRAQARNTTSYEPIPPESLSSLTFSGTLRTYLDASTFTVENVSRRDGVTLVTLTATGLESDDPALLPPNATNLTDYRASVVVDSQGRIYEFTAGGTYSLGGERHEFDVRYELVRLDEPDVERPSWVSTALADGG